MSRTFWASTTPCSSAYTAEHVRLYGQLRIAIKSLANTCHNFGMIARLPTLCACACAVCVTCVTHPERSCAPRCLPECGAAVPERRWPPARLVPPAPPLGQCRVQPRECRSPQCKPITKFHDISRHLSAGEVLQIYVM